MAEGTYSIAKDLDEAKAMANALEDYVRDKQLYGSVGGGFFGSGNMPSLTAGALVMRLRRLRALSHQLSDQQLATLQDAEQQHEHVRKEWTVHYENKLKQEAHSRLGTMRAYFRECRENPRICAGAYKPEALRRTIVEEITREMSLLKIEDEDLNTKLRKTDTDLRGVVKPSDFIWSPVLQPVYEAREFWWLYHKPPYPDET